VAARLNNRHQDAVRQKIKASQLLNVLQNHALDGNEISASRLQSAQFLLSLVISKPAQTTEHVGDVTIRWKS